MPVTFSDRTKARLSEIEQLHGLALQQEVAATEHDRLLANNTSQGSTAQT